MAYIWPSFPRAISSGCRLFVSFFLGLDPEDGGYIFTRNVGIIPKNTALQPKGPYVRSYKLCFNVQYILLARKSILEFNSV
jgi:hypothetical protein